MAFFSTTWYVSSVKYTAVTAFAATTAYTAGQLIRQLTAPAVGSERVFVCIVAGTSGTEPSWTVTRGAKNTSTTPVFQECTGHPAVNGDVSSTPLSSSVRSLAVTLGEIIKNNSSTHFFICSIAGTPGASEPSYNTTAGATTTDGTCTWTSIGAVGSFAAWGAPHARLANAYATNWGAAGNKFWLADNHAETRSTASALNSQADVTIGPTYAICVDRTAALPPVEANYKTGAAISTTSSGSITFNTLSALGNVYYQGISFTAGDSTSNGIITFSGGNTFVFRNCAFVMGGTGVNGNFNVGGGGGTPTNVVWDNCTVQFAATGQKLIVSNGNLDWRNTPSAIQGATFPTALFSGGYSGVISCRGVDFSAFSGTLLASTSSTTSPAPIVFEDCKFHASMTRYAPLAAGNYPAASLITVRCDSGATNYKSTRDEYSGVQTAETSITRVGGATDGTTATSDKIVTNAQAQFLTPFRMLPLAIWNETTGADVTVTVYGTINSASLPKDDEIWMEIQYLGSSGSPVASFKSTSKSHPLATAANVASDGSSWNGGGSGAGWSPFKLVATLTSPQPRQKGYIYVNVRAAKASTTYYIDPQPTLS